VQQIFRYTKAMQPKLIVSLSVSQYEAAAPADQANHIIIIRVIAEPFLKSLATIDCVKIAAIRTKAYGLKFDRQRANCAHKSPSRQRRHKMGNDPSGVEGEKP
jgi:hypothetical protein